MDTDTEHSRRAKSAGVGGSGVIVESQDVYSINYFNDIDKEYLAYFGRH